MDVDMLISAVINSVLGTIVMMIVGNKLFRDKNSNNNFISISPFLLYTLFLALNHYTSDRLLKTFISVIILIIIYKRAYNCDWSKSITVSFVFYLLILISEMIVGGVLSVISVLIDINILVEIKSSILANIIIYIPVLILTNIFKNQLLVVVEFIENRKEINMIFLLGLLFLVLSVFLNRFEIGNWAMNYDFYVSIGVFIILLVILFLLLKQYKKQNDLVKKYRNLASYSKLNDEVLEEYRIKNHEYKNQLAIIKSMIEPQNRELTDYVDMLLIKNKYIKYNWVTQIKNINLSGLKGLLNYKIAELISLQIDAHVTVSNDMKKVNFENFSMKDKDDIYSLIGVYLDNAKEAALESDEKKVYIDISLINEEVKIVIRNTYKNKQVGNSLLDNYGYSTKGKERGVGLYMANKIISKNHRYRANREIANKYFTQTLYIKMKKDK